jgi:hypothetical protein
MKTGEALAIETTARGSAALAPSTDEETVDETVRQEQVEVERQPKRGS